MMFQLPTVTVLWSLMVPTSGILLKLMKTGRWVAYSWDEAYVLTRFPQHSTCHAHRAVNQANADRHDMEATGIGAIACGRHGCFIPHSVVDFQKGERYE